MGISKHTAAPPSIIHPSIIRPPTRPAKKTLVRPFRVCALDSALPSSLVQSIIYRPLVLLLFLLLTISPSHSPSHRPLHQVEFAYKLATPKLAYLHRACTTRVAPSKLTSTFTLALKVVLYCCTPPPLTSLTHTHHNTAANMAHTATAQDSPHEVPKRPRGMSALQTACINHPLTPALHRHPQELELLPANLSRRSHLAHQ